MKSDFINNMTHEFKTPIATINLAIDAIKKKLMGKVDTKSMGYLNIIKDENNRMNNQVENVLMISQLEKEKIELEMKMMDLNKLVQLAIDRVELLSGSVGARITKKFDKKENIMMLAEEEMINVFNLGIGYCIVTSPNNEENIHNIIEDFGFRSWTIGEIVL